MPWSNQFKDYPETILRRLLAIRQGVLEPERGLRFIKRKIDRIDEKIREMKEMRGRLEEVVSNYFTGYCPLGKILKEMEEIDPGQLFYH